jgi:hypothetical protein
VREYTIQPFDCTSEQGWGPSDVAWRSRDTISLARSTLPVDSVRRLDGERDTRRAVLARLAGTWMLDTSKTAAGPPRSP